jgi:2-isopropylmalate synthase
LASPDQTVKIMLKNPNTKYQAFPPVHLPDRKWPNQTLSAPPVWLSTDLRDGNQALFEPMNGATKLRLFKELVRIGFKEIEVGFPSASQTDFDFVRSLIVDKHLPDDVTPMVITQSREELIEPTVRSLKGAKRGIVHLYNAVAPAWRELVFGLSIPEVMDLVKHHVGVVKKYTDMQPETEWILQYSPEVFSMTELEVSLEACNTAIRAWNTGPGRRVIINLPTTIENAMPNIFADQIEWMHRHLEQREHVTLSVHTHNDRGSGVAAAEMAQLAGAQRVEGCLFGNGERCGNVDIVTMALNLYTQGIDPGLDFSDINATARIAEECTQLPIHPRHPYVGDLVFTAFSGSHQDAIKKGFAAQKSDAVWRVPYLPIDPSDLGRTYDSVIRVNSQSGKGGIAYLLERNYGVVMPRRMQVEFSAVVQRHTDASESEMTAPELWSLFNKTYLEGDKSLEYRSHHLSEDGELQIIELDLLIQGKVVRLTGSGTGPIDAAVHALGGGLKVSSYEERSVGSGADAKALAMIEASCTGKPGARFGAGLHANIVTASLKSLISAACRLGVVPSIEATPAAQKAKATTA